MRLLLALLLAAICVSPVSGATTATKDAITWTFDANYTTGQFVTGDWYVVVPSGNIEIAWIEATGGETLKGTMKNPVPGVDQGYSSSAYSYSSSLDVGQSLPISLTAGDRIVTVTSHVETTAEKTAVGQAAILTVVSSIQDVNAFRPGYCDNDQVIYSADDIDYTMLANLTLTPSAPTLAEATDMVARPWIDHKVGWQGRNIHPNNNMRDYGLDIIADVGMVAAMANGDFTNAEKKPLIVGIIQLGIDNYSIVKRYPTFYAADPGHTNGRKFPIVAAAYLLDIAEIKAALLKAGDYVYSGSFGVLPTDAYRFSEDEQTFYVTQDNVDITNSAAWDPDNRGYTQLYTSAMIGMPEWGERNAESPENSSADWKTYYRQCCTMRAADGQTIALYAMGLVDAWNHPAYFAYMDRYKAISDGLADPFGFTVNNEDSGYQTTFAFCDEMWDEYRNSFDVGPARSGGYPTASLPTGTTSTTVGLSTGTVSICKYSPSPSIDYGDMTLTFSTADGGYSHTYGVSGLVDSDVISYYIKCNDLSGSNTTDYTITVEVEYVETVHDYDGDVAGCAGAGFVYCSSTGLCGSSECCSDDYDYCYTVGACTSADYYWCDESCGTVDCVATQSLVPMMVNGVTSRFKSK